MATSNYRQSGASKSSQSASKSVPFAMLPHGIASDRRLHPVDRVVICGLLYFAQSHGWCRMSNGTLADYVGVDVATIKRSLFNLKDIGYIESRPGITPGNKTGRILDLLWVTDETIIPAPPPIRHEDRVVGDQPKLHDAPTPRRRNRPSGGAPVSQVQPQNDDDRWRTSEPAGGAVVHQPGGAPLRHKEEGIQEQKEALSPHLTSSKASGVASLETGEPQGKRKRKPKGSTANAEQVAKVQHDPEEVEAAADGVKCLINAWTPRTRREVLDLIAECGPDIVSQATMIALLKRDFPPYLKGSALRYMYAVARQMKEEGGPQSDPIGCQNPLDDPKAPWSPSFSHLDPRSEILTDDF